MMFGLGCFAISMWNFTPITHDWGWRELLLPQAFRGFAQQFCDRGRIRGAAADFLPGLLEPHVHPTHARVREEETGERVVQSSPRSAVPL